MGPQRSFDTARRLEAALDSYFAGKGDELRRQHVANRAAIAALRAWPISADGPRFPSILGLVLWCTALRGGGPLGGLSGPPKGRTVGSEWTKTEAADEAEAAATIAARVKCLMRCARTVAKPRRFHLNRTPRGLSTAEIVSQSAGRDGSKIENGKRSNLFPFELPTRRAAGAELVFPSHRSFERASGSTHASL